MRTATKDDLHRLIETLPEAAVDAADAFLSFLHARTKTNQPLHQNSPNHSTEQNWAAGERRGLTVRRERRNNPETTQDPSDTV